MRLQALLLTALIAAGPAPKPVRVQPVVLVPGQAALTASGTVQPRTQAELAFRVPGKVVRRMVEIGDRVRAGQALAQLDPADLRLQQQSAEAARDAAEAEAANAQADLRRYSGLGKGSPAYLPSEMDKRGAAARMAAARLMQATRQAALARDQAGYGVLTADADSVITALPVQAGQVVAAGQTVAVLAHTNEIEVAADIPEGRVAGLRRDQAVSITAGAAPGETWHGRIREIGALADPASRTFTVRVTVLDASPQLALGMTAALRLEGASAMVAALPSGALADQGGRPAVWVLHDGHAALRPVELAGYAPDGSVLVRAGLAAGEQVATAGVALLTPDMPVVAWAGAAR